MLLPGLQGAQRTAEVLVAFTRSCSADVLRDAALRVARVVPFDYGLHLIGGRWLGLARREATGWCLEARGRSSWRVHSFAPQESYMYLPDWYLNPLGLC